jgi:all-trans-retinol 13,14-reductase
MTLEKKDAYDAIVIGSGIGGLAAAAVLARIKRYRVLVLEQHFKLGGFTHTFQRPGGFHWDVGLHYVGEMNPGNPLRRAMDFITVEGVDWIQMKDPFETFLYPDFKFEVPSGREIYLKKLASVFPGEAVNLRRYFRDLDLVTRHLPGQLAPPGRTPWRKAFFQRCRDMAFEPLRTYLDRRFRDERLKAVVASQWGDYGLPPKLASFGTHAVIARHYLEGGYYPIGSAATLAEAIGRVIRAAGGELKVRSRVRRILSENGRTTGVELQDSSGLKTVSAPEVYSDAGAEATFGKLLPQGLIDPEEMKELNTVSPYGVVTLYLGLKSRCEHLGLHGQNFWMYDGFDHDAIWEKRNQLAEGVASSCYLSFPGLKDPAAGRPTAEIIAPLDYGIFKAWQGKDWMKRGKEYRALKEKITQALLDFVENRIPGLRAEIVYAELSTPLSVEHFTGHREGGIYGYPGTPRRYGLKSLKAKTPLKGLSLVGADVGGLGIAGSMMGGILGVAAQHGVGVLLGVFKGK